MDAREEQGGAEAAQDRRSPTAWIGRRLFNRALTERGPSLNIARLMTSRHLVDLQWIAALALLVFVSVLVVVLFFISRKWVAENGTLLATALGASLAAINWCYQTGNSRLGVIDLFGCEISTLCRVLLVTDFARLTVERAAEPPADPHTPRPFTSQEDYTPVYDKQIGDLIPFDVSVVKNVAEFYSYYKTMVDYLRARAAAAGDAAYRALTDQMLYMLYLMCESGRMATVALIEFDPDQVESVVNILCSELVLYAHLARVFADDYRGKRLILRRARYDAIIQRIRRRLFPDDGAVLVPAWSRARATWVELERRYADMCVATAEVWAGPR